MRVILTLLILAVTAHVEGQELGSGNDADSDVDVVNVIEPQLVEAVELQQVSSTLTTEPQPETTTRLPTPEEMREARFDKDVQYLFLIPKQFYVQTNEVICLLATLEGVLEYRVNLLNQDSTVFWDSDIQVAREGETCLTFTIPAIEPSSSFQTQTMTVTLQLRRPEINDRNQDGFEVTKEKRVTVRISGGRQTFVQTDKPIYRPGQIVRFRALTLNSELKTVTEPFDQILIENPARQRINQFVNVEGQEGLIDLEHELPEEPQQGTYTIKVTRGNDQIIQTFRVEEYVLPRFEVEINAPTYILITDTSCNITICGKYTSGQPVQGSVEANVTASGGRYDWRTRTSSNREVLSFSVSTGEDGCVLLTVDLTKLELTSRRFNAYGSLQISTIFTEAATDESISKRDDSTARLSRTPFNLRFFSDNLFKPRLPYFGRARITNPDGSPPEESEALRISCNELNITIDIKSDRDGFANFEIPLDNYFTDFSETDRLSCNVISLKYPERIPYNREMHTLYQPQAYLYANPMYSPSEQYLVVKPLEGDVQAGDTVKLSVHSTTAFAEGLYVIAVSRGNIIHGREFSYALQEGEETIYDVSFVLTPSMTPKLSLLIYGLFKGEMVADMIEINSNAVFENEVHIQFADGQQATLEPGADTSLEISASPGSLCAVGVVDKSVHLLAGNNQIRPNAVVNFLNKFQLSSGDPLNRPCEGFVSEPVEIPEPFPVIRPVAIARKKRQFFFPFPWGPFPKYEDVTKEFEQLGLVRISNLFIETSPCEAPFYDYPVAFRALPQAAVADANQVVAEAQVAFPPGSDGDEPSIRSYFPETWLWHLQRSEESPLVKVPDTITEWIGSGFCISSEAGFGLSDPFTLRATKPLFADYNLPYSVIRGEEFELQIIIFNYADRCLPVEVILEKSDGFVLEDNENRQRSCVCSSSEPTKITFNVSPTKLGEVFFQASVIVVPDGSLCGTRPVLSDIVFSDGLRKPLLVEPEGESEEDSFSDYFCPKDGANGVYLHQVNVTVPENYVEESGRVIVLLTGDIMGSSLSNIDRLLRIPYGCGEQNMIGFVPNIYVLQYLIASGQAEPIHISKAKSNMRKGYQTQLNFRLRYKDVGSYSAFGDSDLEGSAWLTAYVIRSFAQASQFISIDDDDLHASINWLLDNLQMEDGCFVNRGRVIHKEMQGGVNDGTTLTAFILVSLLEAGLDTSNTAVKRALECVVSSTEDVTDTYSAALIAYALSVAKHDHVHVVLEFLESIAFKEGGVKWWESNRPQTRPSGGYRYGATATSLSIEMTAYVLHTYINVDRNNAIERGSGIAKWLVSQQGPHGGFQSTQDTVVAIHALAEYAELVFSGNVNLGLAISYPNACSLANVLIVHEGNRLILQQLDLLDFPETIFFQGHGEGCALLQVIIRYNVRPILPSVPPFNLTYSVTGPPNQGSCKTNFNLKVCASYNGEDQASNMAIIEVTMVSGFAPDQRSIHRIRDGIFEDLTRVEQHQKKLLMYYRELNETAKCFDVNFNKVLYVKQPAAGLIIVYDYYDLKLRVSTKYKLVCEPSDVQVSQPADDVIDMGISEEDVRDQALVEELALE